MARRFFFLDLLVSDGAVLLTSALLFTLRQFSTARYEVESTPAGDTVLVHFVSIVSLAATGVQCVALCRSDRLP